MPSRQLVTTLFSSLGYSPWTLLRTLHSDNPLDLQGELRGTATFISLPPSSSHSHRDWLYCEEGEIPTAVAGGARTTHAGLRWTKKYIWRLGRLDSEGRISVWFLKAAAGPDETDSLFHDFDFAESQTESGKDAHDEFVAPPTPPPITLSDFETTVLAARGNHLCINDMYRTAYAFRIRSDTGEVLSWASRHVVRGPKKDQDIVNRYVPIGWRAERNMEGS